MTRNQVFSGKPRSISAIVARFSLLEPAQALPDVASPGHRSPAPVATPECALFSPPTATRVQTGTLFSKNVCVETTDGHRRRFLPKHPQPIEVISKLPLYRGSFRLARFLQKNHLSLPTESPRSSAQKTIELPPFRCRRGSTQLCFQIVHDLILLTFSACLVRRSGARQETKESQRVTPVSTELSRFANSCLPRHGIIRYPAKSTGNSFPLARTQTTMITACDLICTNHCHVIAAPNQRGIDPNVLERGFFGREQEIHLRLPAFVSPPNSGHAVPVSPRVVCTKPKTQHELVESTRSLSVLM